MLTALLVAAAIQSPSTPNTLTPEEAREGFVLLFDGKSTDAWRGYKRPDLPPGWSAVEGELRCTPGKEGGDIVTREQYGDFDFRIEFKISEGGNSGLIFRVSEDAESSYMTGPEFQILDDANHPASVNPLVAAGSNYALHARTKSTLKPHGEWNAARIVAKGAHIEHWLNGEKIVEYELWTEDWKKRVAASKFGAMKGYGMNKTGHLALQDHGDLVGFRSIRVKRL